MSRNISFTKRGVADYLEWQTQDKKILRKINELIKDIERNPFGGIGKQNHVNKRAVKNSLIKFFTAL